MQKNEFEKQMQKKMDELQIHPSDSVWENVKLQITKQKRRDRGVIILLSVLAGILLGGYWLLLPGYQHAHLSQSNNTSKKNQGKSLAIIENKKIKEGNNALPNVNVKTNSHKNGGGKFVATIVASHKNSSIKLFNRFHEHNKIEFAEEEIETVNSYQDDLNRVDKEIDKKDISENIIHVDSFVKNIESLPSNSLSNEIQLKNKIPENNSSSKNITAHKKVYKWKFGLLFSGGISEVADNFLQFDADKNYSTDITLNGPGTGSNGSVVYPSKMRRSGAFIIGLYAEKNISKNKIITAGLSYKMFSTTSTVGEKNDSLQRYSLSNPANDYHSYYHFIELPVSLKIQLSAKKIPLFLDIGISLSKMISSNALQVNTNPVAYYNNNSLFNKSQIGFNTGFSALLFSNKKTPVLIGPYIYYGATKAAKEGLYKNQHFTFLGLRSQILFKK
jgi:hypothetical protein